MNLLAIDTATEACSAALLTANAVHQQFEVAPRRHGELILVMIEQVLAEAGLARSAIDAIAFGRGPGAFTGVRIAVATAQAIGLGLDRPLVAVSDLAAVAQGAWREAGKRDVLAVIDARMAEVYAAAYRVDERGLTRLCGAETVVAADQWAPPPGAWHGAGSGWDGYAETLRARPGIRLDSVEPGRLPQARDIATLAVSGDRLDPADALPIYLRDQVARPATG